MKFETFKKLRIVAIILVIIGAVYGISQCSSKKPGRVAGGNPAPAAQQQQQSTQRPDYGAATMPVTSRDRQILEMQKGATTSGKPDENGLKQSVTTSDFKLDLRSDTKKGYVYWNRVKVDYNGNRKWDEKWLFEKDGKIEREIAPNDDENYSMRYELQGNNWMKR